MLETGWIRSQSEQMCVDKYGMPIPWLNYPFINFISERLHKNLNIFEYGSGQSTLFWAERLKSVHSVEHEKVWFNKVESTLGKKDNVTYIYEELGEKYVNAITKTASEFDIILVDGRNRVDCCEKAYTRLTDKGVLILDNSERKRYKPAWDFLQRKGFRTLTFSGLAPLAYEQSSTTIFYRPNNCLEI